MIALGDLEYCKDSIPAFFVFYTIILLYDILKPGASRSVEL